MDFLDIYNKFYHTCSECGKQFNTYAMPSYMYKVTVVTDKKGHTKYQWQCSYNCYNHARLRKEKTSTSFKKYTIKVKRCEEAMQASGKTILNPIDLTPPRRHTNNKFFEVERYVN